MPTLVTELPPEIWREILEIAVEKDPVLEPKLISPLATSIFYETVFGDWWLRQPLERLQRQQRHSYCLKKTITQTCRMWARIGVEFLYRAIVISDPNRVRKLCSVLDGNSKLGWWTKGIYFYCDDRLGVRDLNAMDMADCIISLVRHFPNLQVFIIDPQIGLSFAFVADALRTYCATSLRSIQWKTLSENQSKVIPAILCMQRLVTLQIQLANPTADLERTFPGLRLLNDVSFPCLKELSLRGAIQDFVEQIASWHMPELSCLTLDFKSCQHDFPDVVEALVSHGPQLEMLDINAIPTLDVQGILSICTNLTTFCFNLDWQLEGIVVNRVHLKLENIGLYGLRHAFGVGYVGEVAIINPLEAVIMRRRNDINFAAITKASFPKLRIVRVLDPGLLNDLNKNDGPAGICYERWERWWEQCASQRIRLEDCTGSLLGTLPQREGDEDDEDDEESESEGGHDNDSALPLSTLLESISI